MKPLKRNYKMTAAVDNTPEAFVAAGNTDCMKYPELVEHGCIHFMILHKTSENSCEIETLHGTYEEQLAMYQASIEE